MALDTFLFEYQILPDTEIYCSKICMIVSNVLAINEAKQALTKLDTLVMVSF